MRVVALRVRVAIDCGIQIHWDGVGVGGGRTLRRHAHRHESTELWLQLGSLLQRGHWTAHVLGAASDLHDVGVDEVGRGGKLHLLLCLLLLLLRFAIGAFFVRGHAMLVLLVCLRCRVVLARCARHAAFGPDACGARALLPHHDVAQLATRG